jgi:hypothetical protein
VKNRTAGQNNDRQVCITCGVELHPERALKYDYCTGEKCQRENAKGLTMLAVGVNKSAEQFEVLNERTRSELASGKYHDQRRASFGKPAESGRRVSKDATNRAHGGGRGGGKTPHRAGSASPATSRLATPATSCPVTPARPAWTDSQQRLAVLYNQQGMRPDEIAEKLHVSRYLVTQMILAAAPSGKQGKR